MSLTEALVRRVRSMRYGDPDLEAAARVVLDTVACAVGARGTPAGAMIQSWAQSRTAGANREALTLAGLAHILEMDDLHRESVTHPGAVVVPTALAVGREMGASGQEVLVAVLQGYEVMTRIGAAVGRAHYRLWHNTATCGPFGSAMAAAHLLALTDEQAVWALGNAGTQASGLWEFLEAGCMSKHLHTARAAEAGLDAAGLAGRGFTGPGTILEGDRGFFRALCPDPAPERVLSPTPYGWEVSATSIKPWPSCRHTHPAIDAALEIAHQLEPAPIETVEVETYAAALALCDRPAPATEYAARFSLQHCVLAALEGEVGADSFDDASRAQYATRSGSVRLSVAEDLEAAYPARWGARVTAYPRDGTPLTATRPTCLGDPEAPLSNQDLRRKAVALLESGGVSEAGAGSLADRLLALSDADRIPDLPVP